MSFVIRVRTSQGMHRLNFPTNTATFGDLQKKLQDKYGISPDAQVISRQPPNRPDFIENINSNSQLTSINLKHGDIIYLIMVQNQIDAYKAKNIKIQNLNNKNNKSSHSFKDKPIDNNNDQKTSDPHASTTTGKFVLKPLPQRKRDPNNKKGLHRTLNDLKTDANKIEDTGPKHVPFHEWIQERQKKFKKTPWNIDPPKFDYKPVAMGQQVNFNELPPNAVIKRQKYRHVDVISFYDSSPYKKFKTSWEKNSTVQKCAYLIGKFEYIPNTITKKKVVTTSTNIAKKDDKLMCGKVYALYEPPQFGDGRGVKLLKDRNEALVNSIISTCGMERIGIIYTTLPRGGSKYNGDIFMSGDEIFTSAKYQEKYRNQNTGYSKFCTLITHIGTKEAQCFMISDQGVAMIKNGLIGPGSTSLTDDAKDNYGFMMVNKPPPKIYLPGVINENIEIKQGKCFPPDALLVNIISTIPNKQEHIFNYVHFPSVQDATVDHVRQHLLFHKDKEFHISLSDFNLLLYLTKLIDINLVKTITKSVVNKKRLDDDIRKKIYSKLRIAVPGWS